MTVVDKFNVARRNRRRAVRSEWKSWEVAPKSLGSIAPSGSGTLLTAPAYANLRVAGSVALQAGDFTLNVSASNGVTRSYGIPALAATQRRRVGFVEENQQFRIVRGARAFTGTISVYYMDSVGKARVVATATFT